MYMSTEKAVARIFLQTKIPDIIRLNEIGYCDDNFDAMECYEALFDCAHCILEDVECDSIHIKSIESRVFIEVISKIASIKSFYSSASQLLRIIHWRLPSVCAP